MKTNREAAEEWNKYWYTFEHKEIGTSAYRGFLAGAAHVESRAENILMKALENVDENLRESEFYCSKCGEGNPAKNFDARKIALDALAEWRAKR